MLIDEKKLELFRTADTYAQMRREAEEIYAGFDDEIPALKFQDFMDFKWTGGRALFEEKYFMRRKRLNFTALICLLYQRDEDMEKLHDIIWAICDEYTWSLPAHINSEWQWENAEINIDLFAAETGFALSEILEIFDEKLDDYLKARVRREIKRRIIDSFLCNHYFWEAKEMNWAAVCGGSVGACFLYGFQELFPLVKDRLLKVMDTFLLGFGEDGCCREGAGYWNYGFGYFVYFADLLKTYTNGQIDLFKKEIVKKAACFQQRIFLNANSIISFSDCVETASVMPGLTSYLKKIYPNEMKMPEGEYDLLNHWDGARRFASLIRNIAWTSPELLEEKEEPETYYYYPDAQWYYRRIPHLVLAAKGGHNEEPHNHNDLGNFILADDQSQVICDLGSGVYNRAYFSNDTRYLLPNTASFGHSVPLIDGEVQQFGKERAAEVLCTEENRFSIDISKAYDVPELEQYSREFSVSEDIKLTDSFRFGSGEHEIIERFIFNMRPTIEGKKIIAAGLQMCIETDKAEVSCHEETTLKNNRKYYAVDCKFVCGEGAVFSVRFSPSAKE